MSLLEIVAGVDTLTTVTAVLVEAGPSSGSGHRPG
jgi:hypothetical protein